MAAEQKADPAMVLRLQQAVHPAAFVEGTSPAVIARRMALMQFVFAESKEPISTQQWQRDVFSANSNKIVGRLIESNNDNGWKIRKHNGRIISMWKDGEAPKKLIPANYTCLHWSSFEMFRERPRRFFVVKDGSVIVLLPYDASISEETILATLKTQLEQNFDPPNFGGAVEFVFLYCDKTTYEEYGRLQHIPSFTLRKHFHINHIGDGKVGEGFKKSVLTRDVIVQNVAPSADEQVAAAPAEAAEQAAAPAAARGQVEVVDVQGDESD